MHNTTRRSVFTVLSATALIGLLATATGFGPLNPPAGTVTGTAKPLSEVEPRIAINATNTPGDADSVFRISQAGSYYLTGNVSAIPSGKSGIEITTSDVTVDLSGFRVEGFLSSNLDGIVLVSGGVQRRNIVIRNGTVVQCGGMGINLAGAASCTIKDIHAVNNTGIGISAGTGARVEDCTASVNSSGIGIVVGDGSGVSRCVARGNGNGGIQAASGCTITGCSALENGGLGIKTGIGGTITSCTAQANTGGGISTGIGNTITGCSASNNIGNGISTTEGCTITGCTASFNSGVGISSVFGSTISNCTARRNALDAIRVDVQCAVLNNLCTDSGFGSNAGAAIHVAGIYNRIEGNTCSNSDRGIDVDASLNIIIKNTCSLNAINWDIAADNIVGPIINRTIPISLAIIGNSGPDSTGSTHPNANFTH